MVGWQEIEHKLDLWGQVFKLWGEDAHGEPIMWTLNLSSVSLEFSPKVLIMSWLVMIIIMVFAFMATRNMSLRNPKGAQNIFEMIMEAIRGQINQSSAPERASNIYNVATTFIIFLLVSNLIGLIPTLMSPTAHLNTTVAYALITFGLIWFYGIKYKGVGGYFKHWLKPFPLFLPLNVLEEFVKPVTLAARLFGNIYAGEVLICTWLGMFYGWYFFAGGFVVSVVWLAFSIFISCIQAFVFTVLTINYVAMAVAEDGH